MKSSFNDTIALFMAKSKNRTRGHFEDDVFYFFSYFYLILLIQMRCGCCSIVCLRLQVMQAKQVDCKIITKINFFFLGKHFVILLDNCKRENINPRKSG